MITCTVAPGTSVTGAAPTRRARWAGGPIWCASVPAMNETPGEPLRGEVTRLRFVSNSAMWNVPAAPWLCPRLARKSDETQGPGRAGVVTCASVVGAVVAAIVVTLVATVVGVPVVLLAEEHAVNARASRVFRTCAGVGGLGCLV